MNSFISRTFRYAAVTAAMALTAGVLPAQVWKKVDGSFQNVHTLFFPKNNAAWMVVAADDLSTDEILADPVKFSFGKGYTMSSDSGKTFGEIKLDNLSVRGFAQLPDNPQTWFAAVNEPSLGGVAISYDAGQTWENSSQPRCNTSNLIGLAIRPGTPLKYYGADIISGVVQSADTFETCSRVFEKAPLRDIAVSPVNPNLMFAGASGPPYGGVYVSSDGGETWHQDDNHNMKHLRVLSVHPSSTDPNIVFCSADSLLPLSAGRRGTGIYRSLDGGITFQLMGAEGARVYSIIEHPREPRIMLAAGDSSGIWVSGNWGKKWEPLNSGLPANAQVRVVGFPNWEIPQGGPIAFAGLLNGGGLYRSAPIATSVEPGDDPYPSPSVEPNFPNPFSKSTAFYWNNPRTQPTKIAVTDMFGKEVDVLFNGVSEQGRHFVEWNAEKVPAGVYMLTIKAGTKTIQQKLMVTR